MLHRQVCDILFMNMIRNLKLAANTPDVFITSHVGIATRRTAKDVPKDRTLLSPDQIAELLESEAHLLQHKQKEDEQWALWSMQW